MHIKLINSLLSPRTELLLLRYSAAQFFSHTLPGLTERNEETLKTNLTYQLYWMACLQWVLAFHPKATLKKDQDNKESEEIAEIFKG